MQRMVGERRRAIVLASIISLLIYLAIVALAKWLPNTHAGNILTLPWYEQTGLIAPIWLGAWFVAMAQRELIAHGEGIYGFFLAFTQMRGMRFLGLTLGLIMAVLLAIAFFAGNLSAKDGRDGMIGALTTLVLLALGLPDAPAHTYQPPMLEAVPTSNPSSDQALMTINQNVTRR